MNASDDDNGNNIASRQRTHRSAWRSRAIAMLVGLLAAVNGAAASPVDIATSPLFLGSSVPGTLVLTPSVEWPTADSLGNLGDTYDATKKYGGYFDPDKCYLYSYNSVDDSQSYFYPVNAVAANHACATTKQWSGDFLDWVATQTIDPWRQAMTGGYRAVDTTTDTQLQKARQDGKGAVTRRAIGSNTIGDTTLVGATPAKAGWGQMKTRVDGQGYKLLFTRNDSAGTPKDITASSSTTTLTGGSGTNGTVSYYGGTITPYNPGDATQVRADGKNAADTAYDTRVYSVNVRVRVCVSGMLETNCKQYGSNYKPEGLIQQYSSQVRYSIFGYLNNANPLLDGGVMRANQKYVGQYTFDPIAGPATNPNNEWDPTTGVLVQNPNPADVTATNTAYGTSIADSGVINYLNKFGELNTNPRKSKDNVSEMYYAAIRYLKHQGNVAAWSSMSDAANTAQKQYFTDGFPVITSWNDPINFRCQTNAILGIGDTNTHDDKNLPGSAYQNGANEPSIEPEVTADTTVNVATATAKIAALEGITITNDSFAGGDHNSAYIAGLAYDSHTVDMRSDLPGSQTVSTYWSDVEENQVLKTLANNQYWLATKYGGFRVPAGYSPYTQTAALPQSWWDASGDVLSTGDPRPDNFYTAGDAAKMVRGLQAAFAQIVASIQGTGASFGASSTSLQNGTTLFQSSYFSNTWNGDLTSYPLDPNTGAVLTASWSAGALVTASTWSTRTIYVTDNTAGTTLTPFIWSNLSAAQKTVLGSQNVVDFLRGDRSKEQPGGALRTRVGVLGDIVDSQPIYVGAPNGSLYRGASFTGASTYQAFVTAQASRTPVVYVGVNDGMLHGFNASTGAETFAFVPKAAITSDLFSYTQPAYSHRYNVDGELTVANVYFGGAWKTVLVGTMGRGNPGVFALDVTDPANPSLLWDKTATDIPALGNNIGKPIIAQVANGDWRVSFGNGPNSSAGNAQLVTIKLSDGTSTSVSLGGGPNNGLSGATIWNSGLTGYFDRAYAGDLLGNLWRIDGFATATPTTIKLFTATDSSSTAQAITATPIVAVQPGTTQTWVFFGTGRYLGISDLASTAVQTWYGIKDAGATITGRSALVQRSIVGETTAVTGGPVGRAISAGALSDLVGKSGWYIDLVSPVKGQQGERMVVPNIFQGLALIGVTRIPTDTDACSPGGSGWVMAINPFTGGRLDQSSFDVTGDGIVNGSDTITVGGVATVVSGLALTTGGNGVIAVGTRIYGTLDNGGQFTPPPPPSLQNTTRVNWHEVIGN